MILQDALCDIRESLMQTGYFFKFYEYASMTEVNGVMRPMYHVDGENVINVMDFDRDGSGYIRKLSSVVITPLNFSTTACNTGDMIELRYPLRGVFAVPKDKLNNNGYSDDMLSLELMDVLHGSLGLVGVSAKSKVTRIETDRYKIWKDEGAGNEPLLSLSYISIDFDLIFTVDVTCLKETCY